MTAPIVFLHGLMGAPALWDEIAPAHARRHTFPGHDGRPCRGEATLEAFADDLAAQLDEPSVLVATSMGAAAALIVAARRPDRVAGLVLTGATPCLTAMDGFPHAPPKAAMDRLAAGLEADFKGACRAFCTTMAAGDRGVRDRLLAAALKADPATAVAVLRDSAARDLRPLLTDVRAPALVLAAEDDAVTPPAAQAALADMLGARFERTPAGGHALHLTRPERVRAALSAFAVV